MSNTKTTKELAEDRKKMWELILAKLDPLLTERDKLSLKYEFEKFYRRTIKNSKSYFMYLLEE